MKIKRPSQQDLDCLELERVLVGYGWGSVNGPEMSTSSKAIRCIREFESMARLASQREISLCNARDEHARQRDQACNELRKIEKEQEAFRLEMEELRERCNYLSAALGSAVALIRDMNEIPIR